MNNMGHADDLYRLTVRGVAAGADCAEETVRLYADLGLIDCVRIAGGVRLFRLSASSEVRAIKVRRMEAQRAGTRGRRAANRAESQEA
jgi:hypothetical protein